MAKTSKTPHERVRALLSKTQANGATEGEEDAAVSKALQIIVKDHLPIKDFLFPEGYGRDGKKAEPEPETAPAETVVKRPVRIIKQAAESLLLEVTGKTSDGFTTGYSYEYILAEVKKEFPHANTSIKCLRWYATHMKEQGCRMPQKRDRPAPKPKAEKAAA